MNMKWKEMYLDLKRLCDETLEENVDIKSQLKHLHDINESLLDEKRVYKRLSNSTNRGISRVKNEDLQDMKNQFKNIQNQVGKLQKENKRLRGKIEVRIEKDTHDNSYVATCKRYPGCLAGDDTIAKTKKAFEEAFISYLMSMLKHGEYFKYIRKDR